MSSQHLCHILVNMFKLAASEAARGGGGIEIPSSEFVTDVCSLLALPHQQSMVRLKYNTKVYAISYPPLDHEIAGFGGLF